MAERKQRGILAVVPDGWYTRKQVAERVGRSIDVIRDLHNQGIVVASGQMQAGQLKVWLYSEEDLASVREVITQRNAVHHHRTA